MHGWDRKSGPVAQHWTTTAMRGIGVVALVGGAASGVLLSEWTIAGVCVVGFVQAFAFATVADHLIWYVESKARSALDDEDAAAVRAEETRLRQAQISGLGK